VYQYTRRVPDSVVNRPERFAAFFRSQPIFRRSLKTKDQAAVYAAAQRVHDEFEDLLAQALGRLQPVRTLPETPPRTVTQADLDRLTTDYREAVIRPFRRAYLLADADPLQAQELERLYYQLDLDAEDMRNAFKPGATSTEFQPETIRETAAWVIAHNHFDAPEGSQEFGLIAAAIRAGKEQGYDYVDDLRAGKVAPALPVSKDAKSASRGITLRQAVDKYIEQKSFGKKPSSEIRLSLTIFENLIGNKALTAITRTDFHTYVDHLSNQMVGGKSAGSIKRPISPQTVKKRLGILCAAINFAIARDWFDGRNPASDIKIDAFAKEPDKALMPDKRAFKTAELIALFKYPWFTGCRSATDTHSPGFYRLIGAEYWVPIVALYTGCRATELGGLRVAEVILDDDHPHLVIRANQYRRIKNNEARNVPILDALLKIGFATYVERVRDSGADRLFPDWDKGSGDNSGWGNSKLIRSFNRTVIPTALKKTLTPDARTEVTFHNFRSAFKTMLVSSDKNLHPNIINEVVGHAKGEMDARYVGKVPIEVTYEAVRGCDYKGLTIPSLPPSS
jgi:integrase